MLNEMRLAQYGMGMQEATIVQWRVQEGASFRTGDILLEVEAAKTAVEIEAQEDGVLVRIAAKPDDIVEVGGLLATIAPSGAKVEDPASPSANELTETSPIATAASLPARPTDRASGQIEPRARKLAMENDIDLASVHGTGPGGRITELDVRTAIAPSVPPLIGAVPLKGLRGTIARKMMQSLHNSAQLTLVSEADVTILAERREALKAEAPISFTEILIPAVARALLAHPHMNATIEDDEIRPMRDINIGVAVQTDKGLMVPVIYAADKLGVRQIAEQFRVLVAAVKSGTASPAQLSGGSFTITNLGAFGIDVFTPILQSPQIGILGVGRVVERFAKADGTQAWRMFVTLSLTFDHRGVDGAPAAEFLKAICGALESPDTWING